ncbi:MAG: response regulator transcription factor, partial [Rhizobacter sp.]|nr:response regulator transcription factor [Chlorobiales bacterium]
GAETFRHLQSHHPQVKVLLSTGYADAAPVHELIKAGILGVLAKPYNADTLIAAVRSALQTSSTHIPPDAK